MLRPSFARLAAAGLRPGRRPALATCRAQALSAGQPGAQRSLCSIKQHDQLATKEIERIMSALQDGKDACCDTFQPRMEADGTLLLDLGDKGQYSLQKAGDAQLLLFSPMSGPLYYKYDPENNWWKNSTDGHLLVELLVRELMHTTSVYINL